MPRPPPKDALRILLVDDHAVVRQGLKQILAEEFERSQFGEAQSVQEALDLLRGRKWDVVVLDIDLPGRSGLEVLKEVKSCPARIPVLVLSMYPEDQFAIRTLKAGADGYLTKQSAPEELVNAVRKVCAGGKYVGPRLAERMAAELDESVGIRPHEGLSDREYEVMCKIALGKTAREIATEMALSDKTISTYRRRILQKMKFKNNSDLTRYALEHDLVK